MNAIEVQSEDSSDHHWDSCTEILGSESVMEKIDGADFGSPAKAERERKQKTGLKFFPPLLTTLTENGRPIFHLKKLIQTDGRLKIDMARNEEETILRCTGTDGRLMMWIVRSDHGDLHDRNLDDDAAADADHDDAAAARVSKQS